MITVQRKNTVLSAINLLEDFAYRKASGFLKVSANEVSWFIYLNEGKIFYANFSIDPIDRLELYVRKALKAQKQSIDRCIFDELRQRTTSIGLDNYYPSHDYQVLNSLVSTDQLLTTDGALIAKGITKEAIRSFLLLSTFSYDFIDDNRPYPILWSSNFFSLSKECQSEISDWRALKSNIYSPYQRPFLIENSEKSETHNKYEYLQKFLVGTDFNYLSLVLNRSAIKVAQNLELLIADGIVGLRPPKFQYSKLPKLFDTGDNQDLDIEMISTTQYKIISIDDSPVILRQISDFLDHDHFQLFQVEDPRMALSKIITVEPHIILMDIDMPNIDGYKLCSMVRRNSKSKKIPIIMVTSNSGLIDRGKAKLCGATDYLTKPFTQNVLNEKIFKYLSN
jgi:two-component system, chemotaxis family, response regulator PixG